MATTNLPIVRPNSQQEFGDAIMTLDARCREEREAREQLAVRVTTIETGAAGQAAVNAQMAQLEGRVTAIETEAAGQAAANARMADDAFKKRIERLESENAKALRDHMRSTLKCSSHFVLGLKKAPQKKNNICETSKRSLWQRESLHETIGGLRNLRKSLMDRELLPMLSLPRLSGCIATTR